MADWLPALRTAAWQAGLSSLFSIAFGFLLMLSLQKAKGLSAAETSALNLLAGWDGRAYAPGEPGGSSPFDTPAASVTDGPAATLFQVFALALWPVRRGGREDCAVLC